MLIIAAAAFGRAMFDDKSSDKSVQAVQAQQLLRDSDLRHAGLHDAGKLYLPLVDGLISTGFATTLYDPETGDLMSNAVYPKGSHNYYIWGGAIWVGGIVGQDTIVSVGFDGWIYSLREFTPENAAGSMHRTGNFADDEFVTALVDTFVDFSPYSSHGPLGISVRHTSRSWADTAYNDFVLIDYTILNTGSNYISDGWAGIYLDNDIYNQSNSANGWADDCTGSLDTLLSDDDPGSRVLVGYSFDNDGDPMQTGTWGDESVPGIIALVLLDTDFPVQGPNFNWWFSNGLPELDFGPRRLGTPGDPLRMFFNDNLGTPVAAEDKYYIMSHPEVDYDQIEIAIHDSSDGWMPPPWPNGGVDFADGYDTRFLYSFGPFDLAPGDSVSFTVALVAAATFHVNPGDFANYFDAFQPDIFRSHLDFSELMTNVRRADSVYRSGYLLPNPGPPADLHVVDYDDAYVELAWSPSSREDLAGYNLYIMDTLIDRIWHRVSSEPIYDTGFTVPLFDPTHAYSLAINLFDTQGRQSLLSRAITLVPGIPHPPEDLTISLDGAVPEISWLPHDDTTIQVFMIYRKIGNDSITLYDSTAAFFYRDYGAESGVRYLYYVTSRNDLGLESDMAGPVEGLYMARDRGVLFNDLNRYVLPTAGIYPKEYADYLYSSVAAVTMADRFDVVDTYPTFKELSHYSAVIFEASNRPRSFWFFEDTLAVYLRNGGNAIIITPALGYYGVLPKTDRYGPGNFYHDFLKLDSSYNPGVIFSPSGLLGDLTGCVSQDPDYPSLVADPAKLAGTVQQISGFIPLGGYLFPTDEAEPIYRYISSNPDTSSNGRINGIRYLGDDYRIILFSFPLLPMEDNAEVMALSQALTDLGINMGCGDANNDGRTNIGDAIYLINYLYRDGPVPTVFANADVVCDGQLNMADVLVMVNLIFREGQLRCCP